MFLKRLGVSALGALLIGGTIFADVDDSINKKVQNLISKMTLDEKVGQLVQISQGLMTGPHGEPVKPDQYIKEGKIGSFLNAYGADDVRKLQKIAVEDSRLKIPLLFGLDVIHGYKTIFPVPLAMACTWNPLLIEEAQRTAAKEASVSGISWTFAPMLDIARDPRWGRIVEGFGEDPYLSSVMAVASVKGFQGDNSFSEDGAILACAKHYVGYGAVQAGRDYYTVDMTKRTLWDVYMPPYEAAIKAGVLSVMPAFTTMDGIPMCANKELLYSVLRKQLGFNGLIVSDWDAIHELIAHGVAANDEESAKLAITAGTDIDMMSNDYANYLKTLVETKKVPISLVDSAVAHVLYVKYKLGLFENPYKYCNADAEKKIILSEDNRTLARKVARESIVLLKNGNDILPLNKGIKNIAIIGPLANDNEDLIGPWACNGSKKDTITVFQAIKNKVSKTANVEYQRGSNIEQGDSFMTDAAVNLAKSSDVVIAVLGEDRDMSGEAASRANISIPEAQENLLKQLYATGKPIILVLMNGRPLTIPWESEHIDAILETWFLGTEAGNAIADVIFGDYNPSGKLTATFPRSVGQIPIFYEHLESGRPSTPETKNEKYVSKYLDMPNSPLYPFGYGLSYTTYSYSPILLSKKFIKEDESITASVEVKNMGDRDGEEIVELYIRDMVASISKPVKKLIGFKKVFIPKGEVVNVSFTIKPKDLEIYNSEMKKVIEPGEFKIFIGTSSKDCQEASFTLEKG